MTQTLGHRRIVGSARLSSQVIFFLLGVKPAETAISAGWNGDLLPEHDRNFDLDGFPQTVV